MLSLIHWGFPPNTMSSPRLPRPYIHFHCDFFFYKKLGLFLSSFPPNMGKEGRTHRQPPPETLLTLGLKCRLLIDASLLPVDKTE